MVCYRERTIYPSACARQARGSRRRFLLPFRTRSGATVLTTVSTTLHAYSKNGTLPNSGPQYALHMSERLIALMFMRLVPFGQRNM